MNKIKKIIAAPFIIVGVVFLGTGMAIGLGLDNATRILRAFTAIIQAEIEESNEGN